MDGMVDVLFPLLFVDVDVLLGLFAAGEAVTGMGLALYLMVCGGDAHDVMSSLSSLFLQPLKALQRDRQKKIDIMNPEG
jgi:hypothetical protein